jgi:glycosyltransferase domain-containing protein
VDLRDVSVVMPTFKRQVYALRNMRLLDQTGARVHVLDGSPAPIEATQLADLSPRINYLHRPVSYEERMALALTLVDTPFCVSVSDDDMHLPSGLAASVEALNADPSLVAVTGTSLEVFTRDGVAYGRVKYPGLLGRAVLDDDPITRMIDHLADYLPATVYAVTRTPVWVKAMSTLAGKRFLPIRLGELQYEMTVAYQGKTKVVPHLMWLRSSENLPHWAADDVPLAPWWEQAADSGERREFAEYMAGALADDAATQATVAQGVLKAMDTYIEAVNELTALRASLTDTERRERWPAQPILPLAELGRRVAEQGVAVDEQDLAAAVAAVESTTVEEAPADTSAPAPARRARRFKPWSRRRR